MLLNTIKSAVGPKLGRAALTTQIYSPELYLAGGLLAGAASVIMLARAHKKSEEVLEPTIEAIDETKEYITEKNIQAVEETGHEGISPAEAQAAMKPLYGKLVLDAVKLYGPGVIMGAGSIALILASHGVLKNRNRALISTVALIERGFNTYRKRVVKEYGEETDERLYYGADVRKVVTIEEGKDGKTKKRRSDRNHIPEIPAPLLYGKTFDENSPRWQRDRDWNETFLRMKQSSFNDRLGLYGVIFLNDVYSELGFKKTAVGAVSGWCLDMPGGDGCITFGLDKGINVNKGDNRWMLDFNVQGNILAGVGNEDGPELY